MLKIEVGAAAPAGYVRAVFSRKAGGFAAPLDLMRAQARAAGRLAQRGRLRAAFAGYLVSDSDDEALRRLENYGRKYEAKQKMAGAGVVAGRDCCYPWLPFSGNRVRYRPLHDRVAMTGRGPWGIELKGSEFYGCGGALDAPEYMAAGYMRAHFDSDGFNVCMPGLGVRS